jgi:hypothetical protein
LHRRNTRLAQATRQSQVGIRRIDADEHVGSRGEEPIADACQQSQQARQMAQNLKKPHDRERLGRLPHLAPRRLHFGPGHAEKLGVRHKAAQRIDQIGTQRVARRFSRHQTHT